MTKKEIALKMALAHAQVEYADKVKKDSYEYGGLEPISDFNDIVKLSFQFFYFFGDIDIDQWEKEAKEKYHLDNTQKSTAPAEDGKDDANKQKLMNNYDVLNNEGQQDLVDYSDMLARNPRKLKESDNTVPAEA